MAHFVKLYERNQLKEDYLSIQSSSLSIFFDGILKDESRSVESGTVYMENVAH